MREKYLFNLDIYIFLSVVTLMVIGILFIYSSGVSSEGVVFSNEYIKQIIWAVTGLALLVVFSYFDYNRLRDYSVYIYGGCILLLLITLLFGKRVNGAKAWLGIGQLGIQPSEFTKLATILFTAAFVDKNKSEVEGIKIILQSLVIVLIPVALILLQPDMGTALVYIPIYFFILFAAGAKIRYLSFLIISGLLMILFGVLPEIEKEIFLENPPLLLLLTDKTFFTWLLGTLILITVLAVAGYLAFKKGYFYWISWASLAGCLGLLGSRLFRYVLKSYHIKRFIVFLDPGIDPKGAGWNVIQSVTAVGSGGLTGKGFLQGTQSHYRFLPQQSTDFIFSILAEEWGFIGGLIVFILFLIILIRSMNIVYQAKDNYAYLIGAGITGMIFFHTLINIGMAMGIMPITGIPLFFLSYGGSSLWMVAVSLGILQNIYARRFSY